MKRIDFSRYSAIKIGPEVEVTVIDDPAWDDSGVRIIGGANNLLISPAPPPLAVLDKRFAYVEEREGLLIVGGAFPSGRLASYLKRADLGGLEFLGALPGQMGGLAMMNAGMKSDELFNFVRYVQTTKGRLEKGEIDYGYRYARLPGVVLAVAFELPKGYDPKREALFRQMRANQPGAPSAGSFFKNPPGDFAGRLIEAVGLKGEKRGNMAFSPQHANFLVNLGGGTFGEAMALTEEARQRVSDAFGIWLEREVEVV